MLKKTTAVLVFSLINFMAIADSMQGQPAPTFSLEDQSGKMHQLSDYQDQWLVVYFYPKNDTTGCTIEAKAFRDNYATIKKLNADVLGVSLDDAESHRAFISKYDLPFNLLVDANKQMSRDYGVDGGMALFSYAKRQTFIINPDGQIAKHFEKVDPNTHAAEVIGALKNLQSEIKPQLSKVTEVIDGNSVYGEQWPTKEYATISISEALASPEKYVNQTNVISGRVTQVCQKKGCWMILADGDAFVRVDFNDHAFYVPMNSQGESLVFGRLVEKTLTPEQIAHYEAEGAKNLKNKKYELVADAVQMISKS